MIVLMNVPLVLFRLRACTTSLASGSSLSDRKDLVKLGDPLSVFGIIDALLVKSLG